MPISASAQDYGPSGPEGIVITAPRFHPDTSQRLNGPAEPVTLSGVVRYDDLNLRTFRGARELRMRVREEARDVCERLAAAYPVREAPGTSCYRAAAENGLLRANEAIDSAREYGRYEADYRPY